MGTHGAAPALYPNLKYDPAKDFEPIGMAAGTPILIVAKKDFPAEQPQGVRRLREGERPDKLNKAHAGVGSVSHTTCTLLQSIIGAKPTRVAYRGTGPALNDLVGGQVDFMCDQIVNLVAADPGRQHQGLSPSRRRSARPRCRTCRRRRRPGCRNTRSAPGTRSSPRRARRRRSRPSSIDALDKALSTTARASACSSSAASSRTGAARGPQALQKLVESEVARWTPVLKAAGVTAQ